jgi:hypothetical protein
MTWEPGRERIQQLIDDGEIEQVTPDITIARKPARPCSRRH